MIATGIDGGTTGTTIRVRVTYSGTETGTGGLYDDSIRVMATATDNSPEKEVAEYEKDYCCCEESGKIKIIIPCMKLPTFYYARGPPIGEGDAHKLRQDGIF